MRHRSSISTFVYLSIACSSALTAAGCQASASESDAEETVAISEEQALSAGYLRTPFGLVHPDCVHEVDENAPARNAQETCAHPRVASADASFAAGGQVPATNGWVEASWATLSSGATYMHGRFTVPAAPRTAGNQLLYFFPSLEPSGGTAIIQPVLQWGVGAAGGGRYWAIASWYVDNAGHAEHSALRRVSSGDVIDGLMEGSNCSSSGACTWKITSTDVNTGVSTVLNHANDGKVYTQAQGAVLEAYSVSQCAHYPTDGDITFSQLVVRRGSTTLSPAYGPKRWSVSPTCGFSVDANSTTAHTLYYSN
ncbi:hypothetical protein LVJ94_38520 [Pendulispora rubella]|uniref:Uncharacterized protein n=1 Tax=Pendulispora rubella TaxID=2741070 RepID=A0ABZ2KW56_9BACT